MAPLSVFEAIPPVVDTDMARHGDAGTKPVSATHCSVWAGVTRGNTGTSSNLVANFKIIVEIQ